METTFTTSAVVTVPMVTAVTVVAGERFDRILEFSSAAGRFARKYRKLVTFGLAGLCCHQAAAV